MRKAGGSDIVRNKLNSKVYTEGAIVALTIVLLSGMAENKADAGYASANLRSRGTVRCEEAVIDAADLQSVRAYITEKKNTAAGLLPQLGTKFRQQPEGIVSDRNPDSDQGDVDVSQLSWPMIIQAVADSQKVPESLTVLNPENAMHIEGVEERTDSYVTAVADNISRGKAAWADGILLLGNGADNDRAYQAGIYDGRNHEAPELFYPLLSVAETSIEIRHVHLGSSEEVEGRSGCYQNSAHISTETRECDSELYKTDVTWYPNESEPEGGSWHGGYYTCPNHGGVYWAPGICSQEDVVEYVTWSHDIVCGLDGAVHARLKISSSDMDSTDGAIELKAILEEGSGFNSLSWKSEDKLVWTDNSGNILGNGPELTVRTPGVCHCSINVSNTDIDKRTASAAVRVSGLLLRN